MARFSFLPLVMLFTASALAQTTTAPQTPTTSDPQAITLATKSFAAMTGGASIADATLNATVTWIAGSDNEQGIGAFYAKGANESRVDLNLMNGIRSEIRSASEGLPQGGSLRNGKYHSWSLHNCWTDAVWFFPALSSLMQSSSPTLVFSYLGKETWNGLSVQHLSVHPRPASTTAHSTLEQHLSTMDFYLDSNSQLPVRITFMVHPDEDATTDIRSEVRYADYRSVSGILVPYHIQKLLNGSLLMDVQVTNAKVNSGLSDSQFNIN